MIWSWCDWCECNVVICQKCGNNTCNGGHGMVNGKECDECVNAYKEYFKHYKEHNPEQISEET